LDGAFAGFANDGEGFGEDVVESFFFGSDTLVCVLDAFEGGGDTLTELDSLGSESFVGERLDGWLEVVNLLNGRQKSLDGAFVTGTKDFGYCGVEQNGILRGTLCPMY
jgi:hypothetical protein